MKATVFFLELTDAQIAEINGGGGWLCEPGRAYLDARDGDFAAALKLGMYQPAAILDADNAESVWLRLQNAHGTWREEPGVEVLTRRARSMDVGDVIVWADGRQEVCASVGFKPAGSFVAPALPVSA